MRNLEDMSIGQRVVLTFVIVLVILFLLAVFGYLTGSWEEAGAATGESSSCMDATERERIREIVLSGIDKGLEEQIQHLFEVWMKDASEQPKRAMVGTHNAFNAHVRARRQAIMWDPLIC